MKAVSAANKTTLQSSSRAFVHCGRLQTAAGSVYAFTEHDKAITVLGEVYYPGRFTATTLQGGHTLSIPNIDVSGPYATITRSSVRRGLFENARFRIFKVNPNAITDGTIELAYGIVADVKPGEFAWTFTLTGLQDLLGRTITDVTSAHCKATFTDDLCKLLAATYTATGTIGTVTSQFQMASGLSQADGFYQFGVLTITSGDNAGFARDVKRYVSDVFYLHREFPFNVTAGTTFSVIRGCAKTSEACKGFDNIKNFRGLFDSPGVKYLMEGVVNV